MKNRRAKQTHKNGTDAKYPAKIVRRSQTFHIICCPSWNSTRGQGNGLHMHCCALQLRGYADALILMGQVDPAAMP